MDRSKLVNVFDFDQIIQILGQSKQSKYIFNYLLYFNCKTFILEDNYIDKDYLIDYSKFYARSFDNLNKYTKRIHFFSEKISTNGFNKILREGHEKENNILENSYLGFVVVKPIKDVYGNNLIGRTLLKTYPRNVKYSSQDDHRFYIKNIHRVSLFGIPLKIDSLPFQMQDTAVGACATNTCWTVLNPLNDLFGIQKFSPFEVTEMSVAFPLFEGRNFPNSSGLTLLQMKSYFNFIGLETEFIDIEKIENNFLNFNSAKDDVVADAVKAYINMKLPVIAALRLEKDSNGSKSMKKEEDYSYHAAVICGYRQNIEGIKELYLHDDHIGPYSRALPNGKFKKLKNEWRYQGYKEILVEKLIIPIYPKIRLSFYFIYNLFLNCKRDSENHNEPKTPEIFLTELNQYKEFLWKQSIKDKKDILCKSFPRFIWVIRTYIDGNKDIDFIFDGTSVNSPPICKIIFERT
ncbi:MAG: hypothetical protein WA144_11075 [Candidatus Methanoperedens sp.]